MTEKRFQRIYGHKELVCQDNQKTGKEKYFNNSQRDYNKFVDELNNLNDENNELKKENKHLKKSLRKALAELYCKDRKLEELGVNIECCDKQVTEIIPIAINGKIIDMNTGETIEELYEK